MKGMTMKKREFMGWIGVLLILFLFPCPGDAAIPTKINYQGYLTTAAGAPVDGTVQMHFSIYDVATGGSALWSETQSVTVSNGVYSVNLGDVTPINLTFDAQYYLGVKVGTDSEMTPRRVLTSVGYAYRALYVDIAGDFLTQAQGDTRYVNEGQATSVTAGMINPAGSTRGQVLTSSGPESAVKWQDPGTGSGGGWVDDGTVVRLATGTDRVGIGTSTPGASNRLEVNGYAVIGSDSKGMRMRADGILVDLESLGSALAINWQGADTYLNTMGGNVGIGLVLPAQKLHVGGGACFDGNVGIGTSTPSNNLEVNGYAVVGSNTKGIRMRADGSAVDLESLGSPLMINYYGDYHTVLNPWGSGNVGIGTETPQEKLHVAGRAKFDLGTGSINISTPGTYPGFIMYAPNGHRRDIVVNNTEMRLAVGNSGSLPSGTTSIIIREDGHLSAPVLEIRGGADLSEQFEIRKPREAISLEAGMVVVIDQDNPGRLMISSRPYDRRVAGIISGAGGLSTGMLMGQKGSQADGAHAVALTGRVYCLADASNGAIKPGDLLTTSKLPGHAMKVTDHARAQGAILGKAMSSLKSGQGLVLVLVTLQ